MNITRKSHRRFGQTFAGRLADGTPIRFTLDGFVFRAGETLPTVVDNLSADDRPHVEQLIRDERSAAEARAFYAGLET